MTFPINSNLNSAIFKVILTNRRKSGRSLTYTLIINSLNHEYEIWKDKQESDEILQEDESLLKDLTTFNLTTSSKQKLAREQVELPFMQAQESLELLVVQLCTSLKKMMTTMKKILTKIRFRKM